MTPKQHTSQFYAFRFFAVYFTCQEILNIAGRCFQLTRRHEDLANLRVGDFAPQTRRREDLANPRVGDFAPQTRNIANLRVVASATSPRRH